MKEERNKDEGRRGGQEGDRQRKEKGGQGGMEGETRKDVTTMYKCDIKM